MFYQFIVKLLTFESRRFLLFPISVPDRDVLKSRKIYILTVDWSILFSLNFLSIQFLFVLPPRFDGDSQSKEFALFSHNKTSIVKKICVQSDKLHWQGANRCQEICISVPCRLSNFYCCSYAPKTFQIALDRCFCLLASFGFFFCFFFREVGCKSHIVQSLCRA